MPRTESPARLTIQFDEPVDIHRMRNLGEDIWRALRNERRARIDLAEVDRATSTLVVEVPSPSKARLKWTQALVESHLRHHLYASGFEMTWQLPDQSE
jgi:hypothetical protein